VEIFSAGDLPFPDLPTNEAVMMAVARGVRPQRPDHMFDKLWELVELMWAPEPRDRPSTSEVCRQMKAIVKSAKAQRGDPAHLYEHQLAARSDSPHSSQGTYEHNL
jgi:Protein tyrosine and serine/threonine kinase